MDLADGAQLRAIRELQARAEALAGALEEIIRLARMLWRMIDDSDIGHRALRPETKATIERAADVLAVWRASHGSQG